MPKKVLHAPARMLCAAALLAAAGVQAQQRPLWEIGLGIAPLTVPDYRGADRHTTWVLPLPYLVYRGQFLKADREGLRGTFFESDRLELNLSVNGTLPATSRDNPARRGMADLRPTVELGPTADFRLWRSAGGRTRLDLRAPLRTAITVESSPRNIGWLFSPNLLLRINDPGGFPGWELGVVAGPIFATRKYHGYFYSVSPAEATPSRPAFQAPGGYSGSQFTLTMSKRFARYWVGGFVRYDTVAGAAFEDSPLVKRSGGFSAGVGIARIFGESRRMVETREGE